MESDHKHRLIARLDALKRAVEEAEIPDDALAAIYLEMNRLDALFPEGVKTHSIAELKGLGKELWESIDVDEYIREERRSWR